MKQFRNTDLPADLADVAEQLRVNRATLDDAGREQLAGRIARRTAGAPRRRTQETPLRTRIAIIAMLVLGFAFSGSGVGLAISGSSPGPTSSASQYNSPGTQEVLGDTDSGGKNTPSGGTGAGNAQPAAQQTVEAGSTSNLPFTGFAAIPVVLIGVALLGGGFVLRRRTQLD